MLLIIALPFTVVTSHPCRYISFLNIFQMTCTSHGNNGKQLQCNDVSTTSVSKKLKEPRFVPYEPYRAAITPLVSIKRKSRPMHVEGNIDSVVHTIQKPTKEKGKANQQTKNSEELDTAKRDVSSDSTDLLTADNDSRTKTANEPSSIDLLKTEKLLEETKKKLEETKKKLDESQKQLKIQIQVGYYKHKSLSYTNHKVIKKALYCRYVTQLTICVNLSLR